ncbi:MAG: hypothetical protein ACLRMZ_15100 [Blautia marasmi]
MKKFEPDWLTIPQFACIKPETPYHKEQNQGPQGVSGKESACSCTCGDGTSGG